MEGWGTGMKSRAFAAKLTHPIVREDPEAQLSPPAVAQRRQVFPGAWAEWCSQDKALELPPEALWSPGCTPAPPITHFRRPCFGLWDQLRPALPLMLCVQTSSHGGPFCLLVSSLCSLVLNASISLIIFVIKMYLFMSFIHCVHYLYCQVFVLLVFFPPLSHWFAFLKVSFLSPNLFPVCPLFVTAEQAKSLWKPTRREWMTWCMQGALSAKSESGSGSLAAGNLIPANRVCQVMDYDMRWFQTRLGVPHNHRKAFILFI